jgi:5-methylcytosine-specific restriction endonuclease McrA
VTGAADRDFLGFAERCMALLQEGSFNATYKYAVLLSLMDLCLEQGGEDGGLPAELSTTDLARKVVELYWAQCAPFGKSGGVLQQNRGGQAEIVSAILAFRSLHPDDPGAPLSRARLRAPAAYGRLLSTVEWKLIEMPLPKLQRFAGSEDRFLYDIPWDDHVRRKEAWGPGFRRTLRLKPGAAEHLVRLSGLLRPLLEREWARQVAQWNRLEHSSLEAFLFGRDRISTEAVRGDLRELQSGRCFYCGAALGRKPVVDHFLPWARYPNNAIENLVAADEACNGSKRDFLAATDHVERWRSRPPRGLAEIARARQWESAGERTESVVRALYLRLSDGAKLWQGRGVLVSAAPALLRQAFGAPA